MMSGSIVVESVSKRFAQAWAVKEVTLEVHPGEVVGLLGPNGAGKTTTLRMISGLLSPSAGRVSLAGIDMATQPLQAKKKLGFMTSTTALYDRLTAREQLRLFGQLYGVSDDALDARIQQLSLDLDLSAFLDARVGTLSSGQKQRVSIARAVLHEPEILVLDEPTSTLDPLASNSILKLVQHTRAQGRAVLFSTHRMDEAEFLCDRLYFMRKGCVVAFGTVQNLREKSGCSTLTETFLYFAQEEARAAS